MCTYMCLIGQRSASPDDVALQQKLNLVRIFSTALQMWQLNRFKCLTWQRTSGTEGVLSHRILKIDAGSKVWHKVWYYEVRYGEMQCLCNMIWQTSEPSMPDQGCAEKPSLDFIWYRKEVGMWYWCDLGEELDVVAHKRQTNSSGQMLVKLPKQEAHR